jgi:hypothetical protein
MPTEFLSSFNSLKLAIYMTLVKFSVLYDI